MDVQRRPGGSGRDSAGRDGGSAGRRAGQDDLRVAAVTAQGRTLPRGDGGHVMALFPAWHAVATFARLGESRGHRVAGRATGVGAC